MDVAWRHGGSAPEPSALQIELDAQDPNLIEEDLEVDTPPPVSPVAAPVDDPYEKLTEEVERLQRASLAVHGLQLEHHWYRIIDGAGEWCRVCVRFVLSRGVPWLSPSKCPSVYAVYAVYAVYVVYVAFAADQVACGF